MSMIKNILLSFLAIFIVVSCERNEGVNLDGFDCLECYQQKPEWVKLEATVTINDENPFVALVIYKGNFEDNVIDFIDTTLTSDYWVDVHPDQYYSVKAKYIRGTDTIYAVDGDKVKLKHTDTNCDQPCYYKSGGVIDVRLRN